MINPADYSICTGRIYNIKFKKRKVFTDSKGSNISVNEFSFIVRDIPFAISTVVIKTKDSLLKKFCNFAEIKEAKIITETLIFNLVYKKNDLFALINPENREYFLLAKPEDYQDFIISIKNKWNSTKLLDEEILIYNVIANIENVEEKYIEEIQYAKSFLIHNKLENNLNKKLEQTKKIKI